MEGSIGKIIDFREQAQETGYELSRTQLVLAVLVEPALELPDRVSEWRPLNVSPRPVNESYEVSKRGCIQAAFKGAADNALDLRVSDGANG